MKKFILLNAVLSIIFLLVACKPLYRIDKGEYYPTKTIKTFEGGRFSISITTFNPSICRIRDSLVSPGEETSLCLGDYMKSMYVSRPYIYIWYINEGGWSESYSDENGERTLYIMETYPYVMKKDNQYPEYLKFDYITGSGWIYNEPDMLKLPESEQKIFTDLKKDGRLIIDGKEYYNGPYHWEDGEYVKGPAKGGK